MSLTPPTPPARIEGWEVLDLLASLVQKSLVVYEEDEQGGGRYRLLETVRQYARDRLLESGETEGVRDHHTAFFLCLAEEEAPSVARGERGLRLEQLQRIEAEHDNLRAALEWSRRVPPSPGEPLDSRGEVRLRLTVALGAFWALRGYFSEGSDWFGRAVEMSPDATECAASAALSSLRAKALFWAGRLAHDQGRYEAARALLEESLAVFTEVGDRTGIAAAKCELGWATTGPGQTGLLEEGLALYRDLGGREGTAWALERLCFRLGWQEDIQRATSMCEESLCIERELGRGTGLAWALNLRGILAARQGDTEWARSLFQESLSIHSELGNTYGQAFLLENLGDVARSEGDAATARIFFEQSLAKFRQAGARSAIASMVRLLGHLALAEGDNPAARTFYVESLALWRELGDKQGIAFSLLHLGHVAQAQGDCEKVAGAESEAKRAARLFGAAEALREALGAPLPPVDRAEHDRSVAALRTALGEEAFAAAWAVGRVMPLEQAIHYALEEDGLP